jgi:dihydroorotate dehydrogenase (fumarate)
MARRLVAAGADGLVLFNRFVQPDIDLAALEARPQMFLSRRDEMFVPLRWIAILRGQFAASLAATSGIQEAEDVVKVLLAGADVAMLASILLRRGPEHLTGILGKLNHWLDERGFRSIQDLKGLASQGPRANTDAFARADYTRAIASYPS